MWDVTSLGNALISSPLYDTSVSVAHRKKTEKYITSPPYNIRDHIQLYRISTIAIGGDLTLLP